MAIASLSRLPKHKKFNYTPRYYNPDKEERERRREIKFSPGAMQEVGGSRLIGAFRNNRIVHREKRSGAAKFKLAILLTMFLPIYLYWIGKISGIFAIIAVFFILVIFIQRSSRV
jgi:hypothetical protein